MAQVLAEFSAEESGVYFGGQADMRTLSDRYRPNSLLAETSFGAM